MKKWLLSLMIVLLLESIDSAMQTDVHCADSGVKLYSALGYKLYTDTCQDRRSLLDFGCKPFNHEEISHISSSELRTVFMVIDVANGYKRSFVNDEKKRRTAYNLSSFPALDLGYNNGFDIPASLFSNINDAIDKLGPMDLLVFTQDYLNPRKYNDLRRHCYVDYQTLLAGHPGSFIQDDIQYARQGSHSSCATYPGCSCLFGEKRIHILTHRKNTYDAFEGNGVTDPRPPISSLDNCEGDIGRDNSNATNHPHRVEKEMSLAKKLIGLGFPPADPSTRLVTSGISTDSCVRMTSISATRLGYNVSYLEGGTADSSKEKHEMGIKLMYDAGITPITANRLWTTKSHDENMVHLHQISQYYFFLSSGTVATICLLARTTVTRLLRSIGMTNYMCTRKHKM